MMGTVFEMNRRRVIVESLAADADYSINSRILQILLGTWGHEVSIDVVHTDVAWLAEQGYVTSTAIQYVIVARLTQRGLDVAKGHIRVPGIDDALPPG